MNRRRHFQLERLEHRDTPSGMLATGTSVAVSALIRGYTDPNQFGSMAVPAIQHASTVSTFSADPSRR